MKDFGDRNVLSVVASKTSRVFEVDGNSGVCGGMQAAACDQLFVLNMSAASVPVHVHVHVHRETYAVRATEILPCVVPHTYDALLQISRIFRHFTSKQMPSNIQDLHRKH